MAMKSYVSFYVKMILILHFQERMRRINEFCRLLSLKKYFLVNFYYTEITVCVKISI
jgi:hypothetical protein